MLTREELIHIKEEKGFTIEQIAKASGVPVGTLGKILTGQTKKPRTATMRALEKALKGDSLAGLGKARYYEIMRENLQGSFLVREPEVPYGAEAAGYPTPRLDPAAANEAGVEWKKQGEYTAEDYYALPDDVRVELIDGTFFEMEAPVSMHQDLCMILSARLYNYIREKKGNCRVFQSPMDVQFPDDDRTVVQPDISVICDRNKLGRHVLGAPDLVIEIVSPGSRRRDYTTKLFKYAERGVREYWIVDPYKKKTTVFDFREDMEVMIYGFDSRVPVLIWNGELEIDFAEVYEEIKDLYFADEKPE